MCSTACLLAEKLVSHYDPERAVALPSVSDPAGKGGPAPDSMGVQLQPSWTVWYQAFQELKSQSALPTPVPEPTRPPGLACSLPWVSTLLLVQRSSTWIKKKKFFIFNFKYFSFIL